MVVQYVTPSMLLELRFAFVRVALVKSEFWKFAPVLHQYTLQVWRVEIDVRFAEVKLAFATVAAVKVDPETFAPEKFAPVRLVKT